jgi:DNA polymerase III delta subunit
VAKTPSVPDGPLPASQFLERADSGPLPACVVLAGAEAWFRRQATELVIARVFPDGDPGGGVLRLDARDTAQREQAVGAAEELRAGSLFGAGRVVVVTNPEALAGGSGALEDPDAEGDAVEAPPESGATAKAPAAKRVRSPLLSLAEPALEAAVERSVLVLSTSRPVKGQGAVPLVSLVKKGALVVDCRALYDAPAPWERNAEEHDHELARHLVRRAKQAYKKTLPLQEAHALTRRIGSDLGDLEQALETLALYVGTRTALKVEDVDACFVGEREDPVWALVDAVLDGRPAEAMARLESALEQGLKDVKGVPITRPEALFPMVSGALHAGWRRVLAGAEGLARGEPEAEIVRAAGLPPFRAEAYLKRCRRDPRAWQHRNAAFLEAEEGVKGGLVPPEIALTRLVAALASGVGRRT